VFKVVKDSLGGTLVPLVAALVLIGLGIALAHAETAQRRLFPAPSWLVPVHAPLGIPPLL